MDPRENDISIQEEEKGTFHLILLAGHFTAHSVLRVRKAIEGARSIGHNRIAIDFSMIEHMDSTGLGLIINVAKTLKADGGELVAVNPSVCVLSLFQASNAQKGLRIQTVTPETLDSLFD